MTEQPINAQTPPNMSSVLVSQTYVLVYLTPCLMSYLTEWPTWHQRRSFHRDCTEAGSRHHLSRAQWQNTWGQACKLFRYIHTTCCRTQGLHMWFQGNCKTHGVRAFRPTADDTLKTQLRAKPAFLAEQHANTLNT